MYCVADSSSRAPIGPKSSFAWWSYSAAFDKHYKTDGDVGGTAPMRDATPIISIECSLSYRFLKSERIWVFGVGQNWSNIIIGSLIFGIVSWNILVCMRIRRIDVIVWIFLLYYVDVSTGFPSSIRVYVN